MSKHRNAGKSRSDTRNQILSRLKEAEYRRLSRHLEDVPLSFKQTFYEQNGSVEAAYS
jgi:hypothetical protein